jgi:hypothetical protein
MISSSGVKVRFAPRFLHYASRRVRRSEREQKASARSGRNDKSHRFSYMEHIPVELSVESHRSSMADRSLVLLTPGGASPPTDSDCGQTDYSISKVT